jgi:hypothetical protein
VTQAGYRHRIIIMDRSGSIKKILAGQQSGLEEFLKSELALPGKLTVSLWDFDEEIRCMYSFATADEVLLYRIEPRGLTAMNDAVGDAVEEDGRRLSLMAEDERPEDVTVIIASDGLENSSKRRSGGEIREMLGRQQDVYGWRVIYMGTNQDAIAEGTKIGARAGRSVAYVGSSAGSANAWNASANYLSRVPSSKGVTMDMLSFSAEERELAGSDEDHSKDKSEGM